MIRDTRIKWNTFDKHVLAWVIYIYTKINKCTKELVNRFLYRHLKIGSRLVSYWKLILRFLWENGLQWLDIQHIYMNGQKKNKTL